LTLYFQNVLLDCLHIHRVDRNDSTATCAASHLNGGDRSQPSERPLDLPIRLAGPVREGFLAYGCAHLPSALRPIENDSNEMVFECRKMTCPFEKVRVRRFAPMGLKFLSCKREWRGNGHG
jgi:hypothetical protein